jgi:putative molybdopterin biosynthesis protein
MAVASSVASRMVDAGLGILSAARALDLDFIPIGTERYDLIIPSVYFQSKEVQKILETIHSRDFKDMVLRMGGYDVSRTGEELIDESLGHRVVES